MKTLFITAAAVAGLSGAAFAQDVELNFDELDTNGDGGVSLQEVQAADPEVEATDFNAFDRDYDAKLDETEFDAWKQAREDAEIGDQPGSEPGDKPGDEPLRR